MAQDLPPLFFSVYFYSVSPVSAPFFLEQKTPSIPKPWKGQILLPSSDTATLSGSVGFYMLLLRSIDLFLFHFWWIRKKSWNRHSGESRSPEPIEIIPRGAGLSQEWQIREIWTFYETIIFNIFKLTSFVKFYLFWKLYFNINMLYHKWCIYLNSYRINYNVLVKSPKSVTQAKAGVQNPLK